MSVVILITLPIPRKVVKKGPTNENKPHLISGHLINPTGEK